MSFIPEEDDVLAWANEFVKEQPVAPIANGKAEALRKAASTLGVDPVDLGSIIDFESGGNPHKVGGEGGRYKGLIQFGPDEQKRYYNPKDTYESQVENGVVRYFQDRFKKAKRSTRGATLEDLYTTVIAGNPAANRDIKDAFGTSARSGAERIFKQHRPKVLKNIFGGQDTSADDTKLWSDVDAILTPTQDDVWGEVDALLQPRGPNVQSISANPTNPLGSNGKPMLSPADVAQPQEADIRQQVASYANDPRYMPIADPLEGITAMPESGRMVQQVPSGGGVRKAIPKRQPAAPALGNVGRATSDEDFNAANEQLALEGKPLMTREQFDAAVGTARTSVSVGVNPQDFTVGDENVAELNQAQQQQPETINMLKEPEKLGRAYADVLTIPQSIKSRAETEAYVNGQLQAKYPNGNFKVSIDDWKAGNKIGIPYSLLQDAGIDINPEVSQRVAEQRVENPTPDLRVGKKLVQEDAESLRQTFGDRAGTGLAALLNIGGTTSRSLAGLARLVEAFNPVTGAESSVLGKEAESYGKDLYDFLREAGEKTQALVDASGKKELTYDENGRPKLSDDTITAIEKFGIGLTGDLARLITLGSTIPGGAGILAKIGHGAGTFGIDAALQTAGSGASPTEIAKQTGIGAVTGGIFGAARPLSQWAGKKIAGKFLTDETAAALKDPRIMAAYQMAKKTGEKIELTPDLKRSIVVNELISKGVPIGIVGATGYGTAAIEGLPESERWKQALIFAALDVALGRLGRKKSNRPLTEPEMERVNETVVRVKDPTGKPKDILLLKGEEGIKGVDVTESKLPKEAVVDSGFLPKLTPEDIAPPKAEIEAEKGLTSETQTVFEPPAQIDETVDVSATKVAPPKAEVERAKDEAAGEAPPKPRGEYAARMREAIEKEGRLEEQGKEVEAKETVVATGFVPPKHEIKKPIKGTTGAKIIGYEWKSKIDNVWSESKQEYVDKRVSDWDAAGTSEGTGRDIVHHFYVEHPDGKVTVEGIRSAQNILGISESRLQTIAKQEQAAQAYQEQITQSDKKRTLKIIAEKSPTDLNEANIQFNRRFANAPDDSLRQKALETSLIFEHPDGRTWRVQPKDVELITALEESGFVKRSGAPPIQSKSPAKPARAKIEARKKEKAVKVEAKAAPKSQQKATAKADKSLRQVADTPQAFYSQVERTIEQKMPNRASAEQVRGLLKDAKKEELVWLGIDQFLAENPKPTKQEVLDHIRANQADVREVVKDQENIGNVRHLLDDEDAKGITKFSGYIKPTGENYREILVSMPDTSGNLEPITSRILELAAKYNVPTARLTEDMVTPSERQEMATLRRKADSKNNYKVPSVHQYGDTAADVNRIAHVFVEDQNIPIDQVSPELQAKLKAEGRDSAKFLNILENQSDWAAEGKKKGFRQPDPSNDELFKLLDDEGYQAKYNGTNWVVTAKDGSNVPNKLANVGHDNKNQFASNLAQVTQMVLGRRDLNTSSSLRVPPMPYPKSWPLQSVKRMIRYAVENGYDGISWVTGETVADRYDLSKQVKRVNYNFADKQLTAVDHQGGNVIRETVEPNRLEDYIGKDAAKRIADEHASGKTGIISLKGDDLKVNPTWAKNLYDRQMVNEVGKYVKPWGAKVVSNLATGNAKAIQRGDGSIWDVYRVNDGEDEFIGEAHSPKNEADAIKQVLADNEVEGDLTLQSPVHTLAFTPAMIDSVRTKGQPLFKVPTAEELEQIKALKPEKSLRLATKVKSSVKGDAVELDSNEAFEIMRRVLSVTENTPLEKVDVFTALFTKPIVAEQITDALRGLVEIASESNVDSKPIEQLIKNIESAASHGKGVIFNDNRHERAHQTDWWAAKPERKNLLKRAYDDIDEFVKPIQGIIQKAFDRHFSKYNYEIESQIGKATVVQEVWSHVLDADYTKLGLSDDEAAEFTQYYLTNYADKNGIESLKHFEDFFAKYEIDQKTIKEIRNEYERESQKGDKDVSGDTESAEGRTVQETESDVEAEPKDVGEGKKLGKDREPETVAAEISESEVTYKNRKHAEYLRKHGLDAADVPYIPETERGWQKKGRDIVEQSLRDKGNYSAAIQEFNNPKNISGGERTALAYELIDRLGAEGDYAKMREITDGVIVHEGQAGAILRAAQIVAKYDFAKAVEVVTKQLKKKGKTLSDKDIEKLRRETAKYAQTEEELATAIQLVAEAKAESDRIQAELDEIQKALDESNTQRTINEKLITTLRQQVSYWKNKKIAERRPRRTAVYKDLVDKKPALLDKIRAAFGDNAALRMVAPSDLQTLRSVADKGIDEDTRNALVDYTALQILEHVKYGDVIANLKEVTGLPDAEIGSIHADAVESLKGTGKQSDKVRETLAIRNEHKKEARRFRDGGLDLNRLDREILKGVDDAKTVFATLLWNRALNAHDFKMQMMKEFPGITTAEVNATLKDVGERRERAKASLKRQTMERKADKSLTDAELKQLTVAQRIKSNNARKAKQSLDRTFRDMGRSVIGKVASGVMEAVNFLKGTAATGEISYVLRQGLLPLILESRAAVKADWQGVGHGLQSDNELAQKAAKALGYDNVTDFLNEHSTTQFVERIREHARLAEAQAFGVRFTEVGDHNIADEHFSSRILEKIPVYKRLELAYTLPGDLQRLYIYDVWANVIEGQGLTTDEEIQAKKYTAKVVNALTGKGDIGTVLAKGGTLSKLANVTFFSPSLLISRFQSAYYLTTGFATAPKGMRLMMAKKGIRAYTALALVAYILGMSLDPDDDDFGKVRPRKGSWLAKAIGEDTQLNPLAGMDLPLELFWRNAGGMLKALQTGDSGYLSDTISETWQKMATNKRNEPRFLRGKLSPSASWLADYYAGTDYIGRPYTHWGAATSRLAPLSWGQVYDALLYDHYEAMMKEPVTIDRAKNRFNDKERDYANALAVLIPTFLGIGVNQYPKSEMSPATKKAGEIRDYVSTKDAETIRIEGGLRNMIKEKLELDAAGQDTTAVQQAIHHYSQKYKTALGDLISQARSETGLLSFYAKDLSADELRRVLPLTNTAERTVIEKLLRKKEMSAKKRQQ